ncbi:hypothetical protein VTK73DRAFT_2036 [Phialemonium thermophilum]|uniref:Phosphoglycerate mutase n=1 Tax=Phialemonium thermophilum TaxID=223376 RepID=A0ABR3X7E3_9PEZI
MGRPPAYLFVVRHGNRLDAADKQWHLSSPTPYDPPLTYGGWLQARAIGSRINAILRERIQEDEAEEDEKQRLDPSRRRMQRRYRVIVHSSPFLRCIQTSIALASGIAQDPTPLETSARPTQGSSSADVHDPRQSRPTIRTNLDIHDHRDPPSRALHETKKPILRLDAFLGEWLSPGYFELITPPPESVMMLASAKADLLRREDYSSYPSFHNTHVHSNSHSHLWGGALSRSGSLSARPTSATDGLESMASIAGSLPNGGNKSPTSRMSISRPADMGGYVAPVPNYAISSSATIPLGYVAHARDACVNIDYQWDSMRGPLEWGDGGTFGEEWSSMHHRFRKGLQHLVDWYTKAENPADMVTKPPRHATSGATTEGHQTHEPSSGKSEDDIETEMETVVVLVSHGAGCNALIGAITHQPVLMDVAMASLTMAVRKPGDEFTGPGVDGHRAVFSDHVSPDRITGTIPIHEYYDLKLFASTDHLIRSAASTPTLNRPPSNGPSPQATRGRYPNSVSSNLDSFSFSNTSRVRTPSANTALSSLQTSSLVGSPPSSDGIWPGTSSSKGGITLGSGVKSFGTSRASPTVVQTPSFGLWSPIEQREENEAVQDDEEDDMLLNFSHETTPAKTSWNLASNEEPKSTLLESSTNSEPRAEGTAIGPSVENTSASNTGTGPMPRAFVSGLWNGGPRPPGEAERNRDLSFSKRRWTINERSRDGLAD